MQGMAEDKMLHLADSDIDFSSAETDLFGSNSNKQKEKLK
jgi:hypothetical protein